MRGITRREFGKLAALGVSARVSVFPGQEGELRVNRSRLNERLQRLSAFGRNQLGGIDRVAYSESDRAARDFVKGLMMDAGLEVNVDAAGNLVGRRRGQAEGPALAMGSHLDSVLQGGNYDGQVGSMAAIEVAQVLEEHGIQLQSPLEVVIFSNEEGGQTGSRALSGRLTQQDLARKSASGLTLAEGIRKLGGDPSRIGEVARQAGSIKAFLELHVEQGPVLDASGIQLGVVEGIVGIRRWMVEARGFANHAGTTPMDRRQDSLLAAARFVESFHRLVTAEPGQQVGTVGWIEAEPGLPNVIPGLVRFTVEMRDLDSEKLQRIFRACQIEAEKIGEQTGVDFSFESIYDNPPRPTHPGLRRAIGEVADSLGLSSQAMPSGAGHDAQSVSHIAPIGMIFIPSVGGISHSAEEFTRPEDVANGADVLLQTLLKIDLKSF